MEKFLEFVKKDISLAEEVNLFNLYREKIGAEECKYFYDLDNNEDAKDWINMYGAKSLHNCRLSDRYWIGGTDFDKKNVISATGANWWIREAFGAIKDYFNDIINMLLSNGRENEIEAFIKDITEYYQQLIDFTGYYETLISEKQHHIRIHISEECDLNNISDLTKLINIVIKEINKKL